MGIELALAMWLKGCAAVIAVLTAYGAKGDSFRRALSWLQTKASRDRAQRANMDSAWRELMDDSRARQCVNSVQLLNDWMECRTIEGLQSSKETLQK